MKKSVSTSKNKAVYKPQQFKSIDEHRAATPQLKTESKRAKLLRSCAQLAKSEDILAEFEATIFKLGLVGEKRNAKIIFLAIISCAFDHPVSVVVKGSSAGGKNTLVGTVLKLFPEKAYYQLTGMSEKALAYLAEPLQNRMLVVTEAAGLKEEGAYFLRSLLSEGSLKYDVTVGKSTRTVELEGPTGVILTTTHVKLYHDDETRMFSLDVSDTRAQTRKVLNAIGAQVADSKQSQARVSPDIWIALTQWIATGPCLVDIPFGPSVTELMADDDPRLRRDVRAAFGLVAAHALLHQASRKVTPDGVVIADIADYKAVRALVNGIIARGIDAAITPAVRRTVEAVANLGKDGRSVTARRLISALKLDKSGVSRHTQDAIEAGYLLNKTAGKQKTASYVLGEEMRTDRDVLPSSIKVSRHHAKRLAQRKAAKKKLPQRKTKAR